LRQIVEAVVVSVTAASTAPGVQEGSGSGSPSAAVRVWQLPATGTVPSSRVLVQP
jgi:hypothetical protein